MPVFSSNVKLFINLLTNKYSFHIICSLTVANKGEDDNIINS